MYSHLDTPPPKGVGPFVEKLTALGSILDADGVQSVTAPASKSQKPSAHSLLHVCAVRSLCLHHRISTKPTWLTRLLAVTTLPPAVTSMLRTMSPPPGNGQVWKLSVFGSNFTSVFGFANDSLYQTAPFAKAMP